MAPSSPVDGARNARDTRAVLARAGFARFAASAAGEGQPLTIVVNDPHRYTETRVFLDAVFAALDEPAAGAPPALRLLVAAGTHRSDALERSAHEERMAAPYLRRFAAIEWHDADDAGSHGEIDCMVFHRWMTEGGFYLACGSLEPHYFAGVTGAHKTLTVGVMSRASIESNHAHAMSPAAAPMRLAGNPVHEGVVAALRALEAGGARMLAVNQLVVGGRVAALTAGEPLRALEDGVPLVRSCFAHEVAEPLDLVVARVGPPLDRDLYQADKGIKNTETAVRRGGLLVVEAACARGVGIDHFVALLREAPTHAAALEVVGRRGYRLGDHKAVRLRALTDGRAVRVALVGSAVDASLSDVLGMRLLSTREQAASWVREQLAGRAGARALLVEDAGNVALEVA